MWTSILTITLLYHTVHCQDTTTFGEVTRGLPCIKRLNQLYCHNGGTAYPEAKITTFIDDNKALLRRMYGNLVRVEDIPEQPKTPASTTLFVRSVRNFGGPRFRRSVHEGYIEDLLIEENQEQLQGEEEEEDYWTKLMKDPQLFQEFNRTATPKDLEIFDALQAAQIIENSRPKRQAGFPGATNKNDNKFDVCESRVEVTTPFWATNSEGKVRAIVNDKTFEQAIHQEICLSTRTLRCAGDCSCEQKYKWHRLLAYDPNNDCSGIFMDWFLFPSCCSCRCIKNPFQTIRT